MMKQYDDIITTFRINPLIANDVLFRLENLTFFWTLILRTEVGT